MDISKEHGNWLTVGELIRSIQKPISMYADEIVRTFHEKLCKDLRSVGECKSPEDCNKKTKPDDLCKSCKCWFRELKDSHEKGNNPSWHKNCKSAEWSEDHWEVAKFFMPALGSNLSTVKDAQSTDLSSLLNVLEWMNDGVFLGKTRLYVDLVRKLRSQVRNTWAHAPQQELTDDETAEGFSIATDFLDDLEKVWSNAESGKCLKHLEKLKTNGVPNVVESELQSLLLQRHLLNDIKEEIKEMKVERSSDKSMIEEHEERLKNLERALNECSERMSDFESFKENINKQFNNFAEELKSFRGIPQDIHEISADRARAEVLMVEYYLKLGHDLTIQSYSKDGYKANREALKQKAHNIQSVLKICCQQKDPTTFDISDCLARSNVFTSSARFFSLFVRTIIPGSTVDEFLQRCADLAEERKQHGIKINFDCLLADQERSKSIGGSDEDFNSKMEEIQKEFETHYEDLKEDKSVCAHFYYQNGIYLTHKSQGQEGEERLPLLNQARNLLETSLELRSNLTSSSVGIADKVFSLRQLGKICKFISTSEHYLGKKDESKTSLEKAEKYYREAKGLSKHHLGDHELTAYCCKSLGDLFVKMRKPDLAEKEYTTAKEMRENLGLDASEKYVYLLNNLGKCLTKGKRAKDAIELLESARDMAEKLAENDKPNVYKAKIYTSLAIAHNSLKDSENAVKYAKKALELDGLQDVIKDYEYKNLQEISLRYVGNN